MTVQLNICYFDHKPEGVMAVVFADLSAAVLFTLMRWSWEVLYW